MDPSAIALKSISLFVLSASSLFGALVPGASTSSMKTYEEGTEKLVVYTDIPGHAAVPADLLINTGSKIQAKIKSDVYGIRVKSAATHDEWVECFANFTYNRAIELDGILESTVVTSAYQKPNAGWSHTYANIEMSGIREPHLIPGEQTVSGPGKDFMEVDVEIRKLDGGPMLNNLSVIQKAAVHPQHKILKDSYSLVGGKVYFTITYPCQVVIDINGQMDDHNYAVNPMVGNPPVHAITLFANPILEKPSTGRIVSVAPGADISALRNLNPYTFDTMVFEPGVHDIGAGFPVHPKKSYYMPGDAILFGTISNDNLPTFAGPADTKRSDGDTIRLYGYGTLNGVKVPHYSHMGPTSAHPDFIAPDRDYGRSIIVNEGIKFRMEGIAVVDAPSFVTSVGSTAWSRGVDENHIRWVKAVTWRQNGDGFGGYFVLEDTFARTSDDTNYLRKDKIRCTFWKDNNANIVRVIDLPGPNPAPLRIEDCDILYNRLRDYAGNLGAVFAFHTDRPAAAKQTNVLIKDIRFHDRRSNMRVFDLSGLESYTGVRFENIQARDHVNGKKQSINGSAAAPWFGGLIFKDVYFKGAGDNDPGSKGVKLNATNLNTYFETNEFVNYILYDDPRSGIILTLSTNSTTETKGSITKSPDQSSYLEAAPVKLTAIAEYGDYVFSHWSGDATGSQNPLPVWMMGNKSITANFIPADVADPVTINFPVSGTWLVPLGVSNISIGAWGGGGAGGSAQSGAYLGGNEQVRGGGGAGGSYANRTIAVTPGDLVEFTVGAGGLAASSGFTNLTYGIAGGESLVKIRGTTVARAQGGPGGQNANNTLTTGKYISGGPGLAPTSNNIGNASFYGGSGSLANSSGSGGGGGSAGALGNGGRAGSLSGSTYVGPGAGLAGLVGGATGASGHNETKNGSHGAAPGAAGSGAGIRNSAYAFTKGGNGGDGRIVITYNHSPLVPTLSTVSVNGSVEPNPPGGSYLTGSAVSLKAVPAAGYQFNFWSGAVSGTGNPTTVLMDGDKTVTANFITIANAFRENCGGPVYTAQDGSVYASNTAVNVYTTTQPIANTADDLLYQSERWLNPLSYNIPLPNGDYQVTLMFAEIYHNAVAKRTFGVNLEGVTVISNLDIFSKVGRYAAYDETHFATVSDGQLNIDFVKGIDNPKISAIRVIPAYALSTSALNGSVTLDPPGGVYVHGSPVTLTAVPAPGFQFAGWTGDLTGAEVSSTIVMDGNKSVVAHFNPSTDPFTVWAGAGRTFDDDFNNDGVDDGMAWFLGADHPNVDATDLLPKATENTGALVLEFDCLNAADRGTAIFEVQYKGDLGQIDAWSATPIPGAIGTYTDGVVDFVVTEPGSDGSMLRVVATIPAGEVIAGKLFGRLKGVK